jgi:hypothetical protein
MASKAAHEPDIGHNVFGTAVLMNHFCPAGGGQRTSLPDFFAPIDGSRSQFQVKFDRFPFQLDNFEFHGMSLRRGRVGVNANEGPGLGAGALE